MSIKHETVKIYFYIFYVHAMTARGNKIKLFITVPCSALHSLYKLQQYLLL